PTECCICTPPYLEIHSASDLMTEPTNTSSFSLLTPVCKTRVAHGSLSHEMSLIFSAGSLAGIHPPCVLQSFVNHGAVLHKVFVIGDRHFCVERPSIKNFPSGPCERKTIFFNSHQVSKPESSSDLTALDEQMPCLPPPSSEALAALVRELRVQLGMALFGVDVIINIHTHTLTVIDINIFPGYEGVPQFFSSLLSHIQSVLDKQASAGLRSICCTNWPLKVTLGTHRGLCCVSSTFRDKLSHWLFHCFVVTKLSFFQHGVSIIIRYLYVICDMT
uniref:inositol-1,3,4-trisphosphate 5/6-kinase n=1 Tax=Sander lucioperca TaxID=283035 RepID=A0A8D0A7J7_SANLU